MTRRFSGFLHERRDYHHALARSRDIQGAALNTTGIRPHLPELPLEMADMRLGAEILRLILAYEQAIHRGASRTEAAHVLARQNTKFSPEFFEALVTLDPNAEEGEIRKCRIEELSAGMIIQHEVRTFEGALLVAKGQEVTPTVIFKLKNFQARAAIAGDVMVSTPKSALAFVKGAS